MQSISPAAFKRLTQGTKVLERDGYGDKVLLTDDGRIIKLFRRKRWLSSAIIYPYAKRFVRNATHLKKLGFDTVEVEGIYKCREPDRHIVVYPLLQGQTLRDILARDPERLDLLGAFAEYMARLHGQGVYFRSLHLGNVLLLPSGGLGLIDVADLRFRRRPLGVVLRARNFQHLLRYEIDAESVRAFGLQRFLDIYRHAAELSPSAEARLGKRLGAIAAGGA